MAKWFDVQDQEGMWRVGECLYEDAKGMKNISMDGFPPKYNSLYCKHSQKIMPIRSKTKGLTAPLNPLREVLAQSEIEGISTRLELLLMKPNLLELESKYIRQLIRTQLLILTHKIFTTPFEIIREIKMMDLSINKFFINLLSFYLRFLDFSKVFLPLIDKNPIAVQLYLSLYELTQIVSLVLGIHPDSHRLYSHKLNISITAQGFIDFLIMSDGGLLPMRHFLKAATGNIKKPELGKDYDISKILLQLFLEICEKAKNEMVSGEQTKTILILDEGISHFRKIAELNPDIYDKLAGDLTFINKIEALFYLLKPKKTCILRKFLTKNQPEPLDSFPESRQTILMHQSPVSLHDFNILQERINKMEALLSAKNNLPQTHLTQPAEFQRPKVPLENLGEEMFLGSVEWALETGDLETAKKLVKWRRSLLQIGRITGWEVALSIGCRTFEKGEITPSDIIEANYQYLSKQ